MHKTDTNECCPDFSCCFPDLLNPVEERISYALRWVGEGKSRRPKAEETLNVLVRESVCKVLSGGTESNNDTK